MLGTSGLIALSLAGPAAARPDPGTGGLHERPADATVVQGPSGPGAVQLRIDDDAVEYLQIVAGLAAGAALGGAGMFLASRRAHSRPSTA